MYLRSLTALSLSLHTWLQDALPRSTSPFLRGAGGLIEGNSRPVILVLCVDLSIVHLPTTYARLVFLD
jgi:hypothetical protein